jgi:hypothetical protein
MPADGQATPNAAITTPSSGDIVFPLQKTGRRRSKAHLAFVASQPYLVCRRSPCDAHHLKFAQPRALGRKVSDEFTVPLCSDHHRDVHLFGNEVAWWTNLKIAPLEVAHDLWTASQSNSNGPISGPKASSGSPDSEPALHKPQVIALVSYSEVIPIEGLGKCNPSHPSLDRLHNPICFLAKATAILRSSGR